MGAEKKRFPDLQISFLPLAFYQQIVMVRRAAFILQPLGSYYLISSHVYLFENILYSLYFFSSAELLYYREDGYLVIVPGDCNRADSYTPSVHIRCFHLDISASFCFCSYFSCIQPSPSSVASEAMVTATPLINRPRPVPTSSTLNMPLSPISLQACALHTAAAPPLFQVPAWHGC